MCGICGFVRFKEQQSPEAEQQRLESMVQTLYHRGPDEAGLAVHDGVALGMRRLAIIDLGGGTQPIYNEDRTIWTVFNGEIYNYPELKHDLQQHGHIFTTNSDTEVIVHGYEQYGADFPKYLNGMFAIALHDRKQRRLILARDHLGIKPLYYSCTDSQLIFGSEIKAILAADLTERSLDVNSLAAFLSWEYIPGQATLFAGIHKLLPGEMAIVDLDQPRFNPKQYWDIPVPASEAEKDVTGAEWEDRIHAQLMQSAQMQMLSDVPLGAFLSGGVDSSLIVAAMRKTGPVQTFSIGFDDPTYNELGWARKAAQHLGADHQDEIIRPDVHSLFNELMRYMEDPIGDFSIFPTFLVSRLARQHVTVVLSGDGGDELFGGYETYLAQQTCRLYQRLPRFMRNGAIEPLVRLLPPTAKKKGLINKARRFVEGAAYPEAMEHTRWRIFVGEQMRSQLFSAEAGQAITSPAAEHINRLFEQAGGREALQRQLYVDVKSYLCDNILTKVDRMSMAVSLEARVPYLDRDLVELAFRVPEQYKLEGGETKAILKRVAARHIPKDCVYRPKEGFSIPIKHWLNNEFRPLLEEYLSKDAVQKNGLFQWQTIRRLKEEHQNGRENHSHILWSLIVFHDWQRRWLAG
ncbi:MAG: asparagine synthase (glutamine-hydrolyzing) [Candidatus Electrothrix sp. YB6]